MTLFKVRGHGGIKYKSLKIKKRWHIRQQEII